MRKNFALVTFVLTCLTATLLVAAAQLNATAAPLAAHVVPVEVPGNPSCPAGTIELKIEPVSDGTFSDGTLTVTIDVRDTASGQVFDWTANIGVDVVIAKGGPNANVYTYVPEATSDTDLHAPVGSSGQFSDLSHISFCYDVEPPTNTPTNTNTPTDTPTNTPTSTPTDTPTNTPTATSTDTPTNTPVPPTDTPTNTPTDTPTNTPTATSTDTPTNTPVPPTNTPTSTPTNTPTNTPTPTAIQVLGQLKVCKVAGRGVPAGTVFTINVNGTPYNVPAGKDGGLCVLAGQFPLNTQVTVQEVIPAGYVVARIEIKPDSRKVSKNVSLGTAVIKIGTGVTEVIFTNRAEGTPVPTATAKPTRTPGAPTPTPAVTGRLQVCKEDIPGVSASFTFTFAGKTRTIPDGTCTSLIVVPVGSLTITEVANPGYVVSDIYTIPADRLISEDWNARTATVTIVQGNASTQTIVIFQNQVED